MTFLGDVYLDKVYDIKFELNDFIFNLEYPLSCKGIPAQDKVNLCQEKSYIKKTFIHNPMAVCLSNNHIMDFGTEAFERTLHILEQQKILYFGVQKSLSNYYNPLILNIDNKKIALFGYVCPSSHPSKVDDTGAIELQQEYIINDIHRYREKVDFIILQFHWGLEEIPFPKYNDVLLAHACIDAGADLIIGHHAHVIQSHEIYKNKHIFYGIGNFIFPNLNIESKYNGHQFTSRYLKQQKQHNLQSIVITLDCNLVVNFFTVKLEKDTIKKTKLDIPTWIPKSHNSFQKRLIRQRKINMIKKFLYNPKLPNLNQIKRIFTN